MLGTPSSAVKRTGAPEVLPIDSTGAISRSGGQARVMVLRVGEEVVLGVQFQGPHDDLGGTGKVLRDGDEPHTRAWARDNEAARDSAGAPMTKRGG